MTAPDDLRTRLAALGLTQAAFARLAGIRPRQVGRWLAGDARTPRWAILLLDLLQLPGAIDKATGTAEGSAPVIAPAPMAPAAVDQSEVEFLEDLNALISDTLDGEGFRPVETLRMLRNEVRNRIDDLTPEAEAR